MSYLDVIEPLKDIVHNAGSLILDVYQTGFDHTIELKSDDSPVTLADRLANDYIVERLNKLTPHIPIIAEESPLTDYSIRKIFRYFWLVDPLDGTKEFIKKNDEFTVNIALIVENYPVFGMVYAPAFEEYYYATKDKGAFKYFNGKETKINSNNVDLDRNDLKILISRSHLGQKEQNFLKTFNNPTVIQMGSSLKFLRVAEGNADVYFRFSPTMEWDTAASQIILEEAGGSIKSFEDNSVLKYNKPSLKNPGFIAKG